MRPQLSIVAIATVTSLAGCESGPSDSEKLRTRQDEVLRDPFGADPARGPSGATPRRGTPSVTGGGLMDYDRDAMQHDLDRVFSP